MWYHQNQTLESQKYVDNISILIYEQFEWDPYQVKHARYRKSIVTATLRESKPIAHIYTWIRTGVPIVCIDSRHNKIFRDFCNSTIGKLFPDKISTVQIVFQVDAISVF